jgi:D-proline reductase (dithiol) PrdB
MLKTVDSFRFVDSLSQVVLKSWIARDREAPAGPIPWTPLPRPLAECTVALISTAGLALNADRPFDQEAERRNPWWGDPSYRVLPATATERDVTVYHLHIDPRFAQADLNCIMPLQRLAELAALGVVGRVAPRHYSFMGYTVQPDQLLRETVPAIVQHLHADGVDAAVLVPV